MPVGQLPFKLTIEMCEEKTLATAKKTKSAAKVPKKGSAKVVKATKVVKKVAAKAGAKKVVKAKSAKVAKKIVKAVKKIVKVAKKKPSQKIAKRVVKKVVVSKVKKPAKPVAKKLKVVAKAKSSKSTPKAVKAVKAPVAKARKVTEKVTPKAKPAPLAPVKTKIDAAKADKNQKPGKIAKLGKVEKVEVVTQNVKGAKGSIAPMAASIAIVPGKTGRGSVAAAPPMAPLVSVHAPTRPLPKSLTAKAVTSNVLPFNPNTKRVGGLLSEAEILKQSKNDYMSKAQLAFFKQRLTELQAQLRDNAGQTTEHLRELSIVPDPADRATLEEEHALELRARDRERKLLKKVESALLRIEDGSYGYCEETGDPIGVPRLLARPTATLTIEAQERRELKQRMFGE